MCATCGSIRSAADFNGSASVCRSRKVATCHVCKEPNRTGELYTPQWENRIDENNIPIIYESNTAKRIYENNAQII